MNNILNIIVLAIWFIIATICLIKLGSPFKNDGKIRKGFIAKIYLTWFSILSYIAIILILYINNFFLW